MIQEFDERLAQQDILLLVHRTYLYTLYYRQSFSMTLHNADFHLQDNLCYIHSLVLSRIWYMSYHRNSVSRIVAQHIGILQETQNKQELSALCVGDAITRGLEYYFCHTNKHVYLFLGRQRMQLPDYQNISLFIGCICEKLSFKFTISVGHKVSIECLFQIILSVVLTFGPAFIHTG